MSQERIEKEFHHYSIVADQQGTRSRAIGWPRKDGLAKIDLLGSTIEDVFKQAKSLALKNERDWASRAYGKLLVDGSIDPKIVSRIKLAVQSLHRSDRENSCHRCGASLFGSSAVACVDCKWMLCPECGHCGCTYSGPIKRIPLAR